MKSTSIKKLTVKILTGIWFGAIRTGDIESDPGEIILVFYLTVPDIMTKERTYSLR